MEYFRVIVRTSRFRRLSQVRIWRSFSEQTEVDGVEVHPDGIRYFAKSFSSIDAALDYIREFDVDTLPL